MLVAQCDLPNLGEKQPDFSCEKDAQIVKNIRLIFFGAEKCIEWESMSAKDFFYFLKSKVNKFNSVFVNGHCDLISNHF